MLRKSVGAVVIVLLACSAAPAGGPAQTPAAAAFEKLKTLAGAWEVTWEGKTQAMTMQVISAGSAVMQNDSTENMVTMFHLDGDRLMVTHYCAAKNQPRMVGQPTADGKSISFRFLDVTNLASPDAGHMRDMVLTFEDANHFTEQWTFREKGKDSPPAAFRYTRKQ